MSQVSSRDLQVFKNSIQTLSAYIEMCDAGRYEFALDIPTQIYKIFFDRNNRNNDTTLFERVFPSQEMTCYPFAFQHYIIVQGEMIMRSTMAIGSIVIQMQNEIDNNQLDYFATHIDPIPFNEWKEQIVHVTKFVDDTDSPLAKVPL